jgi:beta-aspartyl-dipeptidase (metallo-type)
MLKLIKNGEVYSPEYIGKKDILITGSQIGYIMDKIDLPENLEVEVIDAQGKFVVPGFIDAHVHITGGGGEGGYKTRTPEIMLTDVTKGGVTTVVGTLGTDGTTRTMSNLIAKAKALEEEGITTYILTGSYQVPVKTVTGRIEDDLLLIDKIIGVGEIALSDHRSSQPTVEEIAKVAAAARVGGILSGKAGIVNVHMGDGKRGLEYIDQIAKESEIPITQFILTHVARRDELFLKAIEFAKKGGLIDLTTSSANKEELRENKPSKRLRQLLENDVPLENITFTSDGQGSLPIFNERHEFVGLGVGQVTSLYEEIRDAIIDEKIPMEKALRIITSNVADNLCLRQKGYLEETKDADIVMLDKELNIDTVIAMGKVMIYQKEIKVKGTFE